MSTLENGNDDNKNGEDHNGVETASPENPHVSVEDTDNSNEQSDKVKKIAKRKLLKTLIHFSLIFFLNFTPYGALEVFQSSLNFEKGLGTFSLSLLYGTYALSSLLVGPTVVSVMKPKWALFIALFTHTSFIIANVFPTWATMLTTSAILGAASPMIWITQGTYVNNLALHYCELSSEKLEQILPKFIGIFFAICGISGPVGTLISSLVLERTLVYNSTCTIQSDYDIYNTSIISFYNNNTSSLLHPLNNNILENNNTILENNNTILGSDNTILGNDISNNSSILGNSNSNNRTLYTQCPKNLDVCGPNHCPNVDEHLEVLQKPDDFLIYILMSLFLLFNFTAIVLCFFLPNIEAPEKVLLKEKLRSTCKLMKDVNLWLLLPIFYFNGVLMATINSSYTQSVISCTYGIAMVGYVMMAEATAYCITTLLSGPITKVVTRSIQIVVSSISIIGLGLAWLLWQPGINELWAVVLIVIVHGLARGSLEIQINALISFLFKADPEAAFGQLNVWQSVGYIVVFGYSSLLCFNIKVYSLIGSTVVMVICNTVIEFRIKRKDKNIKKGLMEEVPLKMEESDESKKKAEIKMN